MGLYSTVVCKDREGQVKLWRDLDGHIVWGHFYRNDEVPVTGLENETYSIAMREGGFVNISQRHIDSWTDLPLFTLKVDKWGREITDIDDHVGLLGEKYDFA